MLNWRVAATASNVRLGTAMLKLTTGVGASASDVNEDMAMARGVGGWCAPRPGEVDVQTTTEWETRRMRTRTCWDRESGWRFTVVASSAAEEEVWGWTLGSRGGVMDHNERGHDEVVWRRRRLGDGHVPTNFPRDKFNLALL